MNALLTLDEEYLDIPQFDDTPKYVTSIGQRSDGWIARAAGQLRSIEGLTFGWDSRGGDQPDAQTLRSAESLLRLVAGADCTLPAPHIHPTPSGGVQFHWESGPRYFEVEVLDPQSGQYYFVDHSLSTEAEGRLQVGDSLEDVIAFVRRVGTRT